MFPKTTQKIVPGPGRYESAEDLSNVGKYWTTKFKNSKSKVWNPKSSKRFSKSSKKAVIFSYKRSWPGVVHTKK